MEDFMETVKQEGEDETEGLDIVAGENKISVNSQLGNQEGDTVFVDCSTDSIDIDNIKAEDQTRDLNDYLPVHPEDKLFECDVCNCKFKTKETLYYHKRKHTGQNLQTCNVCNAKFTKTSHLKNHMFIHTGEKPFKCPQCPMSFSWKTSLNYHVKKHNNGNNFPCQACPSKFASKPSLMSHMKTHVASLLVASEDFSATIVDTEQDAHDNIFEACVILTVGDGTIKGKPEDFSSEKDFSVMSDHASNSEGITHHGNLQNFAASNASSSSAFSVEKVPMEYDGLLHTNDIEHRKDQGFEWKEDLDANKPSYEGSSQERFDITEKIRLGVELEPAESQDPQSETAVKAEILSLGSKVTNSESSNKVKKYVCSICNEPFKLAKQLSSHLLVHRDEKPNAYAECNLTFELNKDLLDHSCTHTGSKLHSCVVCHIDFPHQWQLKEHLLSHKQEKSYKCRQCDYSSSRKEDLTQHMSSSENCNVFECEVCGCRFATNRRLLSHMKCHWVQHSDNQVGNTAIDEYRGMESEGIQSQGKVLESEHQKAIVTSLRGPMATLDESSAHDVRRGFDNDYVQTANAVETVFVKMEVESEFQRGEGETSRYEACSSRVVSHVLDEYSRHSIMKVEADDRPMFGVDVECLLGVQRDEGETSTALSNPAIKLEMDCASDQTDDDAKLLLNDHEGGFGACSSRGIKFELDAEKASETEMNYTAIESTAQQNVSCPVCAKPFAHAKALGCHMKVHKEHNPYACNLCDLRFKYERDLSYHQRIHTGERLLTCGVCDAKFVRRSRLNDHMAIHTGERPFKCTQCPFASARNERLKRHLLLHLREKIVCKICGREFPSENLLQRHLKSHETSCGICGIQVSSSKNLVRHMKSAHSASGDHPFKCGWCPATFKKQAPLSRHVREAHAK